MKTITKVTSAALIVLMLQGYQNCSKVNFKNADEASGVSELASLNPVSTTPVADTGENHGGNGGGENQNSAPNETVGTVQAVACGPACLEILTDTE